MEAELKIGDRVALKLAAIFLSYVHERQDYTNVYVGKTGRVIGYTNNREKVAIEFDEEVFTCYKHRVSSHDNGCHGKGKLHHCWYFPPLTLELIEEKSNNLLLLC
jgi:ribosomal protein L21E